MEGQWPRTVLEVGEQLSEQVFGHDADVGLDMVVEHEAGGESGLVLAATSRASAAHSRARDRSWHRGRIDGCGVLGSEVDRVCVSWGFGDAVDGWWAGGVVFRSRGARPSVRQRLG